ncbi:MAG: DUF378 domain-containing protein [bacterium]|nr:DUF378 domain-containing protein [bacterium]
MKYLHKVAFILLLVGGLNWLAFGLFGWDVGQLLGGMDSLAARAVYVLVGLAALAEIFTHKNNCKDCNVQV